MKCSVMIKLIICRDHMEYAWIHFIYFWNYTWKYQFL